MNKPSMTEPGPGSKQPMPLYEIHQTIALRNGQLTRRAIEAGFATEAEIERIRKERVEPFCNRGIIVVWPLAHGKSTGLSGTLKGWMKGQRG